MGNTNYGLGAVDERPRDDAPGLPEGNKHDPKRLDNGNPNGKPPSALIVASELKDEGQAKNKNATLKRE